MTDLFSLFLISENEKGTERTNSFSIPIFNNNQINDDGTKACKGKLTGVILVCTLTICELFILCMYKYISG